jgi:phage tail-like protein
MASGNRRDPLPVFCFLVQIDALGLDNSEQAFFKSVSGLRVEHEVIPVRAGGVNDTTFNLVGGMKWGPLVLKQGFTNGSKLAKWRESWTTGKGMVRSGGTITQLDTALHSRAEWTFTNAWPSKWELGELDASKSELAIETLELSHEGLTYKRLGKKS